MSKLDKFYDIPIDGCDYQANRLGQIRKRPNKRNSFKPKVLKTWDNNAGYQMVALSYNNKIHRVTVHKLIALTFCKKPKSDKYVTVNHIDGNKQNNRADNLEWVTHSENIRKALELGLMDNGTPERRAAISKANSKDVYCYKNGKFYAYYKSTKAAAKDLGYTINSIQTFIQKDKTSDRGYRFSRRPLFINSH